MMKNPKNLLIFAILGGIVGTGFGYGVRAISSPNVIVEDSFKSEDVVNVVFQQQKAWNSGDIDGFMSGYLKAEHLRFSSGGDVTTGWQATLDRYKARYPDMATMGTLEFKVHKVVKMSPINALVQGAWKLTRQNDMPSGLFTLHMSRIDGEWVIVSDHTSSAN